MMMWFVLATVVLGILPAEAADWLQFRGPDGSARAEGADLPISWGPEGGIAWKVDLPGRGPSSPIVAGAKVVLTASSGERQDRLHVLCFEAGGGAKLWERTIWSTGRTACHPKTSMAAPTPASDGRRVFAFWSTNDLVALDLDGDLLWVRGLTQDYPNATSGMGMASSPVLSGKIVIVQVENQSDSFAAGIDADTGENVWRIRRGPNPSWATPVLVPGRGGGGDLLVLESWDRASGHDPLTGRELWSLDESCQCIPSPAVHGDLVLVPSGGITALRSPKAGTPDATSAPEVVWQSSRLRPATASPVVVGGRVHVLGSTGVLTCGDASSGDVLWQLRLAGAFSSTPVAAGKHLYCINEEGLAQTVLLGEKGEVVATSDFGETILATPAIAGGAMYVRSDAHLWKISR